MNRSSRNLLLKLGVAAIAAIAGYLLALPNGTPQPSPGASPADKDSTAAAGSTSRPDAIPQGTYRRTTSEELLRLVDQVDIAERVDLDGYDRECGTGHACSFGPDWTDDVDVAGGHNGCDTRNDILARDLVDLAYRPNTRECVVVAGTLHDPYTGTTIAFTKEAAHQVGIDHLYPLALAWDMGAATWTDEQRRNFANDPRNLLAVSGRANSSKGDSPPGEWLPIHAGYRCTYVAQFLELADSYDLPVSSADVTTARDLAPSCH